MLALPACGDGSTTPEPDAAPADACADLCATEGRCTESSGSPATCTATSAADCAASTQCETAGACALVEDAAVCAPATAAHCTGARNCEKFGLCTLTHPAAGPPVCHAGSDADCKQAFWCGSEGLCSEVDGKCLPNKDEDCANSDLCKEYGECTVNAEHVCVKP